MFSYLSDRTQAVSVNECVSSFISVSSGVPQGSVMGPLLFKMYVNSLGNVIEKGKMCNITECNKGNTCNTMCNNSFKFNVQMYADDVQIYTSCFPNSMSNCVNSINCCLKNISAWAKRNKLQLNPKKTKFIVISIRKLNKENINIELDNDKIELVDKVRNLGVIFNEKLTWSDHINMKIGQVYNMLRSLWMTQSFTPLNIRLQLAKTYLIPCLLYGCEIFVNPDSRTMTALQRLLNNIARYIFNKKKFDHISLYTNKIFGMTIRNVMNFRALILLHKIINSREPNYLYKRITFCHSVRMRSLKHFRFKYSVSEQQFFVYSVRLLNSLPNSLRTEVNGSWFRNKLKCFYGA